MARKVFFSVSMSLDGFMAPEAVPVEDVFSPEGQNDPRVQRWLTKWSELQAWAFPQQFFRENLKLGEGGEEGPDNDIARATYERTGASVMGKRMFDAGELAWPEEAPFHTPVFVVTHAMRERWERPAGPPSTSSMAVSRPRSTRPARPPAAATSASLAAPRRSWST
jgi:dihydrofolate reductase